jgi:hypothetical protein
LEGFLVLDHVVHIVITVFEGLSTDKVGSKRKAFCLHSGDVRYWAATSKQTTKEHPLLGNRFLINRYAQPLLGVAFANGSIPAKNIGATIEELCFLLVRAEGLSMGQV